MVEVLSDVVNILEVVVDVDAVVALPAKVVAVRVDVDGLYVSGPVVSSTYRGVDAPATVFINGK